MACRSLRLPPIFLLPTRLQPSQLHELEGQVDSLTHDINKAEIVVGNITRAERAMFELRRAKLETQPATGQPADEVLQRETIWPNKRKRAPGHDEKKHRDTIQVVRLAWLQDSLERGEPQPIDFYLVYEGIKKSDTGNVLGREILERAAKDDYQGCFSRADSSAGSQNQHSPNKRRVRHTEPASHPHLTHQTTSEHDASLPPVPGYLGTTYSCQRPTPVDPPNQAFIDALKQVRTIRLLRGDQVGVRAYSTSTATLAAYPHPLKNRQDVARLPGCGVKIADLHEYWRDTGQLAELVEAQQDPAMSVLQLFYGIWGVGDATAREFYEKGWRDLDDIVEHGWNSLSRSQQIGVKFYDEFQLKMPRDEVQQIGDAILREARQIDAAFEATIVGGFRRGKKESGDVDVLLSHRNHDSTIRAVEKVVLGLEKAGLITHTLTLSTQNSDRGQAPLPWRADGSSGGGFDTLDKALVVWRDPSREGAIRRRVDIIVSPWRTVGCAMLGWSGGTTFERDVRRYCNKEKGWKFDSSGIRRRSDGAWVDLESRAYQSERVPGAEAGSEQAADMETAERRVFEGLGLPWRRPEERCTG